MLTFLSSYLGSFLTKGLGWLAIWVGGLVAITNLLDLMLSPKQKDRLNAIITRYWLWLEDNRDFHWLRKFQQSTLHLKIVSIITILFVFFAWIISHLAGLGNYILLPTVLGAYLSSISLKELLSRIGWLSTSPSPWSFVLRNMVAFLVLFVLPLVLLFAIEIAGLISIVSMKQSVNYAPLNVVQVGFSWAFGALTLLVSAFCTCQLYFWIVSIVYICSLYFLIIFSWIGRITLLRVAEYPKGPVIAIGVIVAAVGAVAKYYVSDGK